ncbi:MAG: hypothetical protein GF329_07240 [Candidatus Lokiarchaeota archaeon]|nr:hypothetical protein [Candidatus Lokiarchaeota archaeon]
MNSKFPIFIKKYVWLLGQYIQNCLLEREGIRKPRIEELRRKYPELNTAGLINKRRDIFGVIFDWENLECSVRYKKKEYNITEQVIEIVNKNVDREWINNIGFDTRGFDINNACKQATEKIIKEIVNNEIE